jgi:hypothetical protein
MRRALLLAAVALAAIVGAYAIYWHVAAATLAEGIERWAAERRAEGYEIAYGAPEIGGFPFRLEARLESPVIGSPVPAPETGGQRWRWAGLRLTLHARPWTPLDAEASAPGRHDVEIWTGAAPRRFVLDATEAVGQASFGTDGKVSAASARFADLLIAEADSEDRNLVAETASIALQRGAAAETGAEGGDHTQPSLGFQLALGGLVLPPDAETPLGREVETLTIAGAVLGRLDAPPDAAGGTTGDLSDGRLRDALARWRDDGGTLDLASVVAHWGKLHLSGSGTFALDAALQPIGAMSTTISGHDAVIDALVAEGVVTARDGGLAKILLAVLSRPSPVDGTPELTAPLTLQDGHLWAGPAKLLRLPVIDWP